MRFFDFFAGIGGFRLGMEMAGHECVGHCEIDKWAHASYTAMHRPKESEVYFDDIRTVDPWDMPECAEPLESLKTEKECSLSDILEDSVDEQYFLSQKAIERLMSYKGTQIIP